MHQKAISAGREALASLSPTDPALDWYSPLRNLTFAWLRAGRIDEAHRCAEDLIRLIRGPLREDWSATEDGQLIAIPAFALAGRVQDARDLARQSASSIAQRPPDKRMKALGWLAQRCNFAKLWDLSRELMDEFLATPPPQAVPLRILQESGLNIPEAYARTGRSHEAAAAIQALLAAERDWNSEGYHTGQALKSAGEVLRAAGKHPEAATVTELARRLHDDQPFLQRRSEELLELIAEEMSPEEFERAREAAADLKPSAAIELAREALGL